MKLSLTFHKSKPYVFITRITSTKKWSKTHKNASSLYVLQQDYCFKTEMVKFEKKWLTTSLTKYFTKNQLYVTIDGWWMVNKRHKNDLISSFLLFSTFKKNSPN